MPSVSSKYLKTLAATAIIAGWCCRQVKCKRKRSKWSKHWLLQRKRFSHTNLLKELDPDDFRNYLRMDDDTYSLLLQLVTPLIQKCDTNMREAISAHERLTSTLRFLATGRSYEDLKFSTAISPQALGQIIPETCKAIIEVLSQEYMKFPQTTDEWVSIAEKFEREWNFPFCLGAVDGKHVSIMPPKGSGSYYYNYKGTHSIVLMAIVNANYEFILADVGTNGRVSDGGVLDNTVFYELLKNDSLNIPRPAIPRRTCENENDQDHFDATPLPYVFVGDEAFSLRTDFMKPYSQRELTYERRIYNYRLSRARRIVENAFGILAARFRIFHTSINLRIENTETVVMACCTLHNFLRRRCGTEYAPQDSFYQENRQDATINLGLRSNELIDLQQGFNRNASVDAKEVRERYSRYFNTSGKVPWQDRMVVAKTFDNAGTVN